MRTMLMVVDDDDDDVGYVQDVEVEDEMVLQMKTIAIIWWERNEN